jgi:hypothetical protein
MPEPQYDIFFRGEILGGFELDVVKANVGQLFKASPDKIEQLFSGKIIPLKKDLDKATAAKFKQALEKAGAKIYIKLAAGQVTEPATSQTNATAAPPVEKIPAATVSVNDNKQETPSPVSIKTSEKTESALVILPPGSDVLRADERPVIQPVKVDISGIRMASVFDQIEVNKAPPPRAPDVSHISAAPVGADILAGVKKESPPPAPDVSHISIAEAGADLAELVAKMEVPAAPDVSYITTAAVGADILEGVKRTPPPPAPDTSHIRLVQ